MSKLEGDPQFMFKIVVAGSSGAGKTSLLLRYVDDVFATNFIPTIGVDFRIKTVNIADTLVKLQMWDTAGQDRFRCIVSNYYRAADAVIVVCDVTDAKTLQDAEVWLAEARRYSPPECSVLLLGNKVDDHAKREIDGATAKAFADRLGVSYFETSAKTGSNVEQAFTSLAEELTTHRRAIGGGYLPGSSTAQDKDNITLDGRNSKHVEDTFVNYCMGRSGACSTL